MTRYKMNQSNHTPGPWLINYAEDRFDSKYSELTIVDGSYDSLNHNQGPIVLASLNVMAFAPHMKEPMANAYLIASSPELLASLIELESMFSEMLLKFGPCGRGELALEQARAVISKATRKNNAKIK